jgi:hypothetical protein
VKCTVLPERVRGEQQPEIGGLLVREEARVHFDIRICSSPRAESGVRVRRVQPQRVAAASDDVFEVPLVGLVERVGHRRLAHEPLLGVVEGLVFLEEHRDGAFVAVARVFQDVALVG